MAANRTIPVKGRVVDYSLIQRFADLSGDYNPMHIDRKAASKTSSGRVIAHGPIATSLLIEALENSSAIAEPQPDYYFHMSIRLVRPVFEGDTVNTGGFLMEGSSEYNVWVRNQSEELVVTGTAGMVLGARSRKLTLHRV